MPAATGVAKLVPFGEGKHVVRVDAGRFHTLGGDVGFHAAVVRGTMRREFGNDAVGGAGTHAQNVEGVGRATDVVVLVVAIVTCCHTDDYALLSEYGGALRGDAVYSVHVLVRDVVLLEIRKNPVA